MKLPSGGEIVNTQWRSGNRTVCFVAVQYEMYWQAYVSCPPTTNMFELFIGEPLIETPEQTEYMTAILGAKLSWQEAHAFFPSLDIEKYKTYPGRKHEKI